MRRGDASHAPGARQFDVQVEADFAVLDQDHPIGDRHRFTDVMGHQQHGKTVLLPQPFDQLLHLDAGQRIQCAEWFVEQQQTRLVNQRPGQRDALLLATGQRRRPFIGAIGQAHCFQCVQRLLAPVALEAETDVVDDLFPRQQPRFLEHQPRIVARLAERRGTGQQLAASRLIEAGEQAQKRALATTTAPDHGDELPRRNVQIDVAQHLA